MENNHNISPISLTSQSKDNKFSLFEAPIKNTKPSGEITLYEVYKLIKGIDLKDTISEIRSSTDIELKKNIKATKLPYITPSGTFSKRSENCLMNYSKIVCIDIDNCDITMKVILANDTFLNPTLIFTSPSGTGLKILLNVFDADVKHHKKYYEAACTYLNKTYKIESDPAPSNIASACFLSHDPDAIFSHQGTVNSTSLLGEFEIVTQETGMKIHNQEPSKKLNANPHIVARAKKALKKANWSSKDGVKWVRPGKDSNDGHGAIFNIDNKDGIEKFTVFTSNAQPFKTNQGYCATNIICLLEFEDDWGKCLRTLQNESSLVARKEELLSDNQIAIGQVDYFETRTFDKVISDGSKVPDRKKIIGAFLYENTNTFLFSRTNYGKSLLAFQIGYAAATGTSFNDCPALKNQCDPMKVLVVDMEMDAKELFDRHHIIIEKTPKDSFRNLIYIHENTDATQVRGIKLLEKIEEAANNNLVKLIILDNISKVLPDLLKPEEITTVIDIIKRIKNRIGASFLVIGHTTKGDPRTAVTPTSYFGSSALQNFFTEIFFLDTTKDEKFFLCHSKTKRAERFIDTVPVFTRGNHALIGIGFSFVSMQPLNDVQLPLSLGSDRSHRRISLTKFRNQLKILEREGNSRAIIADMCDVDRSTITRILKE